MKRLLQWFIGFLKWVWIDETIEIKPNKSKEDVPVKPVVPIEPVEPVVAPEVPKVVVDPVVEEVKVDPVLEPVVVPVTPVVDTQPKNWKEVGLEYLQDNYKLSSVWKATDEVDIGTLGTILSRLDQKSLDQKS